MFNNKAPINPESKIRDSLKSDGHIWQNYLMVIMCQYRRGWMMLLPLEKQEKTDKVRKKQMQLLSEKKCIGQWLQLENEFDKARDETSNY